MGQYIKDVRKEEEGKGFGPKADKVPELSEGGCKNMLTRGMVPKTLNFADVLMDGPNGNPTPNVQKYK